RQWDVGLRRGVALIDVDDNEIARNVKNEMPSGSGISSSATGPSAKIGAIVLTFTTAKFEYLKIARAPRLPVTASASRRLRAPAPNTSLYPKRRRRCWRKAVRRCATLEAMQSRGRA